MIRAVVFDLDGTLTDTEHVWDEVRRGLAREDGVAWPEDATVAMMGMSTPEWSRYLVETVGLHGSAADAARRTITGMRAAYERGGLAIAGAAAAVRGLACRWPVAIASSSPPELIDAGCAALGVDEEVRVRVSTETVARGKPAPDGYLKACELLAVDPREAVAVEDSRSGIEAALAAGMHVVAIPQEFHRAPAAVLARASVVLRSIDGVTPDLVAGLAGS